MVFYNERRYGAVFLDQLFHRAQKVQTTKQRKKGHTQKAQHWGYVLMSFEDKLKLVAANMKVSAPVEKGDYIKDDVLYCGKCNTPKQMKLQFFGQAIYPHILCDCAKEKCQIERDDFERAVQQQKIKKMRSSGFSEEEQRQMLFSSDQYPSSKIMRVAHKYVDNFPDMKANGKGLLLFGDTGTGKTFAAACIINALIDMGYPCMMTNVTRIINTVRSITGNRQAYINQLARFDVLVIDDLGTESNTEFANEIIHNIIDARYLTHKPTIITTNLTPEDMTAPSDIRKKRLYSRLYEMCIPIKVTGEDRRKEVLKNDIGRYKDLLDL